MRLVTTKAIRNRLALPTGINRINSIIEEVLNGVTDDLESALRTTLAFESRVVDTFYLRDSYLRGSQFKEKLKLRRGLVTEGANDVQVELGPRQNSYLTGNANDVLDLRDPAEAQVLDKDQFVLITPDGLERGIVTVADFRLFRTYVRVTYDCGLAVDRNDAGLFLQSAASFSLQGDPNLTFADANPDTITRDAGDWVADGFRVGDAITVALSTSNDGTYVVGAVATTVLTLSAADALTAEGPANGITVVVGGLQPVPSWLRELATQSALLELTTTNAIAGALQREVSPADKRRTERLERNIQNLMDEHTRYEPVAREPTG